MVQTSETTTKGLKYYHEKEIIKDVDLFREGVSLIYESLYPTYNQEIIRGLLSFITKEILIQCGCQTKGDLEKMRKQLGYRDNTGVYSALGKFGYTAGEFLSGRRPPEGRYD